MYKIIYTFLIVLLISCNFALEQSPEVAVRYGQTVTWALYDAEDLKADKQVTPVGACVMIYAKKNKSAYCLTAEHVRNYLLEDSSEGIIFGIRTLPDRTLEPIKFRTYRYNNTYDLALLITVEPWLGEDLVVRIVPIQYPIGKPVYTIGSPVANSNVATFGHISSYIDNCQGNNTGCYLADPGIVPGNSGGGLFAYNNELVGITLKVDHVLNPVSFTSNDNSKLLPIVDQTGNSMVVETWIPHLGIFISNINILQFLYVPKTLSADTKNLN